MSRKSIRREYQKQGINLDDELLLINEIDNLKNSIKTNDNMAYFVLPRKINEYNEEIVKRINFLYERAIFSNLIKEFLLFALPSNNENISKIGIKILNKYVNEYEAYYQDDKQYILDSAKELPELIDVLNETKVMKIKSYIDSGKAEVKLDKLKKYKKGFKYEN